MSPKRQTILQKLGSKIKSLVDNTTDSQAEETASTLEHAYTDVKELRNVILQVADALSFKIIETQKNEEGEFRQILFKYQGGVFVLALYDNAPCHIQLSFPRFMGAKMDEINDVRTTCNNFNTNSLINFCIYDVDEEDNEIDVTMLRNITPSLSVVDMKYQLQQSLEGFFSMRRFFLEQYGKLSKIKTQEKTEDAEYDYFCDKRMDALLAEDEMRHRLQGEEKYDFPSLMAKDRLRLGPWLEQNHLLPSNVVLDQLNVLNDQLGLKIMGGEQGIKDFFLLSPILGNAEKDEEVTVQHATLSLTYHHPSSEEDKRPEKRKVMMLLLENAACIDHTLYVRINYIVPERKAVNTSRFDSTVYANHTSGGMVVGFDWKDERSKRSEFDYMWKETQDKLSGSNSEPLTPEQEALRNITRPTLGYCCYWGKKLLLNKRYYEALYYLEMAWNMQNIFYQKLDKKGRNLYDELSFELAVCYNKLNQPQKALFYINNIEEIGYNRYLKEETTAMINSHHHNTVPWIEKGLNTLRGHISELLNNEQDVSDELQDIYRFLRRQYIVANIEMQRFAHAEEECKRLIEDHEETQFAQSELNYINELREKGFIDKF